MVAHFEELEAWQVAKELTICIYKSFEKCKDFRFRDQIQAAAVSVMNNIAEGFERKKGSKEFPMFLYIAKGSSGEVRSMLYLAHELKYLPQDTFNDLLQRYRRLSAQLYSFIQAVQR